MQSLRQSERHGLLASELRPRGVPGLLAFETSQPLRKEYGNEREHGRTHPWLGVRCGALGAATVMSFHALVEDPNADI